MHHPQIVVVERDGLLARQLAALAAAERWPLREARQVEPCFKLLRQPGPSVFVLKIDSPPERDLVLLERAAWQLPEVTTIAVGDHADGLALASLAWDLGANYVLFPPLARDLLPDIAAGLMRTAIARALGTVRPPSELAS